MILSCLYSAELLAIRFTIELAATSLYGTHSALAYLGFLAGFETISDFGVPSRVITCVG